MGDSTVVDHAHRLAPAAPDESHVYGACAPGWHSAADHDVAVAQWIDSMRDRGIERVCCLLSGMDLDAENGNLARYRRAFGRDRVRHAPIADRHLVDAATLEETILPFLADGVERNEPIVVHGVAGIGRTGQVLAAWLVAGRDYEPRAAVDAVRQTGREPREPVRHGNATMTDLHGLLRGLE